MPPLRPPSPSRCLHSAAVAFQARRLLLAELARERLRSPFRLSPTYVEAVEHAIRLHEADARTYLRACVLAGRARRANATRNRSPSR